jgi:tRNA (guanine9-N1)-methyltransferase
LSSYVDDRPQPYYIMLTISNEDEDTIENSEIPGSVAIKEYISNNASNVAPNWENSGSESKNAKKRRLKLERQEANKERKRNERKRKKIEDQEKRRKLRELKGPKPLDSIQYDDETRQRMKAERLAKDAEERQKYLKECKSNFTAIIDCAWEDDHTKLNDINSLKQQIMYCYSYNRKASAPAQLILTSLGGQLNIQLDKVGFKDWVGVDGLNCDYTCLLDIRDATVNKEKEKDDQSVYANNDATVHQSESGPDSNLKSHLSSRRVVYLTADSDTVLQHVDNETVYIIGGIVDRNRLKGKTLEKANRQGISTARLPLAEYRQALQWTGSTVLTVLHVFEILLRAREAYMNGAVDGGWKTAFESVLPERKRVVNDKNKVVLKA